MRTISKGAMFVAAAHFVALASPSSAFAQDPAGAPAPSPGSPASAARAPAGTDVIDLKSGGVLRGTIIDAIPNGHARIQLVTGEVATVPWQDIERIERAALPPAPIPAPVAATVSPAGATVWVHIEGSQVAQLQRDTSGDGDWQNVCTAPCDRAVPQGGYRIIGEGIRDSGAFDLSAQSGQRQTLTVDEGSKGGFVLGIVGSVAGGVAIGVGLIVVLAAALARSVDESGGGVSQSDRTAETTGWVISGVGTTGLVGGIVLIVSNARTRVSQGSAASSAAAWLPANDWSRVPSFRDAKRDTAWVGALPPVASVPLFGGSF